MTEQNTPMLSLSLDIPDPAAPAAVEPVQSIQESVPAAEAEKAPVRLDQSQLTEAEKAAIEEFIGKVDVTNPDHVLLFGADAQKQLGEFADSALEAVRSQDTGEVGDMLENLVVELKRCFRTLSIIWIVKNLILPFRLSGKRILKNI